MENKNNTKTDTNSNKDSGNKENPENDSIKSNDSAKNTAGDKINDKGNKIVKKTESYFTKKYNTNISLLRIKYLAFFAVIICIIIAAVIAAAIEVPKDLHKHDNSNEFFVKNKEYLANNLPVQALNIDWKHVPKEGEGTYEDSKSSLQSITNWNYLSFPAYDKTNPLNPTLKQYKFTKNIPPTAGSTNVSPVPDTTNFKTSSNDSLPFSMFNVRDITKVDSHNTNEFFPDDVIKTKYTIQFGFNVVWHTDFSGDDHQKITVQYFDTKNLITKYLSEINSDKVFDDKSKVIPISISISIIPKISIIHNLDSWTLNMSATIDNVIINKDGKSEPDPIKFYTYSYKEKNNIQNNKIL